jgi:hypothetical protein
MVVRVCCPSFTSFDDDDDDTRFDAIEKKRGRLSVSRLLVFSSPLVGATTTRRRRRLEVVRRQYESVFCRGNFSSCEVFFSFFFESPI